MTEDLSSVNFFSHDVSYNPAEESILKSWVLETAKAENKQIASLNIIFCSDEYLLGLNRTYLDHDYFTDILTFGYKDDPLEGEIFISIERVQENATEREIPISEEIERVIIHGILHLCGHKDDTPETKIVMTQKEDHYLLALRNRP